MKTLTFNTLSDDELKPCGIFNVKSCQSHQKKNCTTHVPWEMIL